MSDNQNSQDSKPPETCAALWRSNSYQQNHQNSRQQTSSKTIPIVFCGYQAHPRESYPAKEAICHGCGTKVHFAKVCRKTGKSGTLKQDTGANHYVFALPSSLLDAVVTAKVSYHDLNVMVDTGSSESYTNSLSVQNFNLDVSKIDCHVQMASTNHESWLQTLGATCVYITIREHLFFGTRYIKST